MAVTPVAQETAEGPFYGATRCYYWLHVHAQDGVIHIESPSKRRYTLGDFFAIWRQPLTFTRVGPVSGKLTVFVNGHRTSQIQPRSSSDPTRTSRSTSGLESGSL